MQVQASDCVELGLEVVEGSERKTRRRELPSVGRFIMKEGVFIPSSCTLADHVPPQVSAHVYCAS
jgi:hypothetical protein